MFLIRFLALLLTTDHAQMQEYGSPPAEIMGSLPPGFVSVMYTITSLRSDDSYRIWEPMDCPHWGITVSLHNTIDLSIALRGK